MSAFELNKFAGGFLSAALLAAVVTVVGELVYPEPGPVDVHAPVAASPAETMPATEGGTPPAPLEVRLAGGDADRGKREARKCAACHTFGADEAGRLGPALYGIVDRALAAEEGFRYSGAMTGKGGSWNYGALDGFLAAPRAWLPGTTMMFPGIPDADLRADVILWLRSLADVPAPLPEP